MSSGVGYIANQLEARVVDPGVLATFAKQDEQSTKLDTVNTNLDAIEVLATAIEVDTTAIAAKLPTLSTDNIAQDAAAVSVRSAPAINKRCSFVMVGSGIQTDDLVQYGSTPSGMTVNQTGGNFVLTTGTTANEEFLARSAWTVNGAFEFYANETQSTRTSANNDIGFWLADLVGTALAFTVNSATSITVTNLPGTWDARNVGQFMNLSCWNLAGFVPGRYAIASVSGTAVTFTVAGFPGSGSGVLTAWGWNHYKMVSTNTTTTNMAFNSQRKGWATNADSQVTISTISSKHQLMMVCDMAQATIGDSSSGSQTGAFSARGSRREDLPDQNVELYVFLQARNTTTPVAITWTVGFFATTDLVLDRKISPPSAFNFFTHSGTLATTASGTNADDSATLASPVVIGGRTINASPTASANNDTGNLTMDLRRRLLVYGSNPREISDINITTVTNTTETTLIASVASVSHDITCIVLSNDGAAVTRCDIRDSTTGTVRLSPVVPIGGTVVISFTGQPLKQATAANNWTIQASAATTSLRVSAVSVRS